MDRTHLLNKLKPEVEKIDSAMREDLRMAKDSTLNEVLHYCIFNGGKRIRPLLCILAARICGYQDVAIYRLAIAFEYLHVATLLHDDIIDDSTLRRGRNSVNTIWGNIPAILAGDYLHARSMYLVGDLGGRECLKIFCHATAAMVEGEFIQLHNANNFNQSENNYLDAVLGKTAMLTAAICEIGGVFAKADSKQQKALRSYGKNLGLAFQLVDDLLDYLGDPQKTGKIIGNDFAEGKMTLPIIYVLQKGNNAHRDLILSLLNGKKEERTSRINEVVEICKKYDAFQYVKDRATLFIDTAITRLETLDFENSYHIKSILKSLALYVLIREK